MHDEPEGQRAGGGKGARRGGGLTDEAEAGVMPHLGVRVTRVRQYSRRELRRELQGREEVVEVLDEVGVLPPPVLLAHAGGDGLGVVRRARGAVRNLLRYGA